jgi:hypothetical protein
MEFPTYKTFHESESVEAFTQILKDNQIEFQITEDRNSLDSLYRGGKQLNESFFVKIRKEDFPKVDAILLRDSEKELETVDNEHYLYGFTDEELFDIVSKADEWNAFDFQLAKKILKERGKEINDDVIGLLKKQRLTELSKSEDQPISWIYAGYIFSILGGLLGIFMGLALMTSKKTLPNGERVHTYSIGHREHGVRIFIIGIIMFIVWLAVRAARPGF